MNLSEKEKLALLYNPNLIQKIMLTNIKEQQGIDVSSATNPFMMLLESTASLSASLALESRNIIRKKFPYLASSMDDLYPHLTDNELSYIFAQPSEAKIRFFLEVTRLKQYGHKPPGTNYMETQIPSGTVIKVHDYSFTIINPVTIRIYDKTETPYVEMKTSKDKLAYPDPTILDSVQNPRIVHGNTPVPFIEFDMPVKQVTIKTTTKTINRSTGCEVTIPLTNQYCASTVYVKGASTNNREVEIEQTFSEDYLDPSTPKVYVSLGDNKITFKVPDIYIRSGMVSGELKIKLYETMGLINLPLKTFTSDQYSLTYGPRENKSESTIENQEIVMRSTSSLMGGKNAMTMEEIKKSLIEGTTGPLDVPITDYQIIKSGENLNYTITKIEDTITNRKYIASKPLPYPDKTTQIKAIPDVFMNLVGIMFDEMKSFFPENIKNNMFLIKASTIFRENNGKLMLVAPRDLENINNMDILNKIQHYKNNKYFYNPFTYIVDMSEETTKTRVYHLDNPILESLRVVSKNINITNINATIEKYAIVRTNKGYEIIIRLKGDAGFDAVKKDFTKLQLSLPVSGNNKVYFLGEYDEQTNNYHFKIETNDFITEDNKIQILNGDSPIPTKYTDISTQIEVICYLTDPSIKDTQGYLRENILEDNPDKTSLFLDTINLVFGRKIDYLWSETFSSYTDRKYKRYTEDVYKVYEENIFKRDVNGNIMYEKQSDTSITVMVEHRQGDRVLDDEGNPIKLHNKGDIILDQYGEPIIDTIPGVIKYIDILMLEYEYKLVTSNEGQNLQMIIMSFFEEMLFTELLKLNNKLLEQTDIYYKPSRSVSPVNISVNGNRYTVPYVVKPKITLYLENNTILNINEREVYKTTIGNIINKHLNTNRIYMVNIKDDIKKAINIGISGVKIENIAPVDTEIIVVNDNNRLTLAKELFFTDYNETIVKYDIELNIINL